MDETTRQKIEQLREMIWNTDIPHPTIPEYIEWHQKCQAFLRFIDAELLGNGRS